MNETQVFTEFSARRLGPVRRFFVQHPRAMDALLMVLFAGWALLMGLSADSTYVLYLFLGSDQVLRMQVASVVLTALGTTALVWRRSHPVHVAVAMGALGVLALATTGMTAGFEVGAALALYAVATSRRPTVAWLTTAGVVAALLAAALTFPLPTTVGAIMTGTAVTDPAELAAVTESLRGSGLLTSPVWYQTGVPVLVLALFAVAAGTSARSRRLHVTAFVDAANALARDQEQRARLVQAAERARIAREMHDIVAHSISVMVALGGGAAAAMDWAPERSRAALDELVSTGRSALGDMRRVLGVLHDDAPEGDVRAGAGGADGAAAGGVAPDSASRGGADPEDAAPLEPQPGGVDLAALITRFRATGLSVRHVGVGTDVLERLDASLQLAVYRIIQEALTNALRHAPGTPVVEVAVRERGDQVEATVTDRGAVLTVPPSPGSGRGLVGMRERAAVFGGTVDAGPYGEGWRVRALLPRRETET